MIAALILALAVHLAAPTPPAPRVQLASLTTTGAGGFTAVASGPTCANGDLNTAAACTALYAHIF